MPNYDKIIYVRKSGLDTNDGLTPSTAVLTINKALTLATDVGNNQIIVGTGDYAEILSLSATSTTNTKLIYIYGDVDGVLTGDAAGTISLTATNNPAVAVAGLSEIQNFTFNINTTTGSRSIVQSVWYGSPLPITSGDLKLKNCIVNFLANTPNAGIIASQYGYGRKLLLDNVVVNPYSESHIYYVSYSGSTPCILVANNCVFNGKSDLLGVSSSNVSNFTNGSGDMQFYSCQFFKNVQYGYNFGGVSGSQILGCGGLKILFDSCDLNISKTGIKTLFYCLGLNSNAQTRIKVKNCTITYWDATKLTELNIGSFITNVSIGNISNASGTSFKYCTYTIRDYYTLMTNNQIKYENNNSDGIKCLLLTNYVVLYDTNEKYNDNKIIKYNISNKHLSSNYLPAYMIVPFVVDDLTAQTITLPVKSDVAQNGEYRIVGFDDFFDDYEQNGTIDYTTAWQDKQISFTPKKTGIYAIVLTYSAFTSDFYYLGKPTLS